MKRFFLLSVLATFALSTILISCKKDNKGSGGGGSPPVPGMTIKYEITGSYTGDFSVVYINAQGGNEVVTVTSLPWSLEIEIPNASMPANVGMAIGSGESPGVTGQDATATIYEEEAVVQTATRPADADGYIHDMPTLAHVAQ